MDVVAQQDGRTTYQTGFISQSNIPGKRVRSPTGFGSVPARDDGARFALSHGFALEQVERLSSLALPVDPKVLATYRAEAELAAGPAYRVVRWEGRTPEENRYMLAVNEAVGFVALAYESAWKRVL